MACDSLSFKELYCNLFGGHATCFIALIQIQNFTCITLQNQSPFIFCYELFLCLPPIYEIMIGIALVLRPISLVNIASVQTPR